MSAKTRKEEYFSEAHSKPKDNVEKEAPIDQKKSNPSFIHIER
jgi:hypothetical protein